MKTSVHTSIVQLLLKLFLVTYTGEKDQLFGKKKSKFGVQNRAEILGYSYFSTLSWRITDFKSKIQLG